MTRYRFHDAADHLIAIPDGQGSVKLSLEHPISPLGVRFRDDDEGPGSVAELSGSGTVRRTLFTHRPEAGDRLELEEGDNGTIALVLISPAEEFVGTRPPNSNGRKFNLPEAGNGKAWAKTSTPTVVTDSQHAMLRRQNKTNREWWGV